MKRSGQTHTPRRYRTYCIQGLVPALVIVRGGLYLGIAEGNWSALARSLCTSHGLMTAGSMRFIVERRKLV